MIYEFPPPEQSIKQGDVFFNLPRIEISLSQILEYSDDGVVQKDWEELSMQSESTVVAAVRSVVGIVASQDCDLARAHDVTFCEVRSFQDVEKKSKETKEPKSWMHMLTQQARLNLKWFYLPPDATVGFSTKMGADFQTVFRVPRTELEGRRGTMRKGRLNNLATAHFRERLSDFFRRYPYDEWYPLNQAEMEAYTKSYPDAKPFSWQKLPTP